MSAKDSVIIALLLVNSAAIAWLVATRPEGEVTQPPEAAERVAAIAERLDDVEARISSRSGDRSRSRLAHLEDRLAEVEVAVAPLRSGGGREAGGTGGDDSSDGSSRDATSSGLSNEAKAKLEAAKKALIDATTQAAVADIGARTSSLSKRFAGLKLRMLPEEERWERLRDALGTDGRTEDDLRLLIARREDAFDSATTQTTGTEDDYRVHTTEVDVEQIEDAERTFRDGLTRLFTGAQLETWGDDGWEDAMLRRKPKAGTKRTQISE